MKILWVKLDFLHPTNRGGQIRTLETLKRLHARNEVHFVAYDDPANPEGRERAIEYSSRSFPVQRTVPERGALEFWKQAAHNLFSPLPLAVGRYESDEMKQMLARLVQTERYDAVVCDFLSSAPNMPDLRKSVLFQHNVETMIWRRHADHAPDPLRRYYFGKQAERMFRCEREFCRTAGQVIAVSPQDARLMGELFGVERVAHVPTGVDTEYFDPPQEPGNGNGIVFCGAMDWLPNVDGAQWFAAEIWPLILQKHPDCTLTLAGRSPSSAVKSLTSPQVQVTGTVADIRPYLWNAALAIVPLRIGGGTRLKIYEAMAAGVPVVSTAIGAEGLAVTDQRDILLADTPSEFAAACIRLLDDRAERQRLRGAALHLVRSQFSWETVTVRFEEILQAAACAA